MTALIPLLIRFWPYLAAAAFVLCAIGYHKTTVALAHHAGYSEGESDVREQWDADKAAKAKAIAALALAWDGERQRADESSRLLDKARRESFAPIAARAAALPAPDARIAVPASAVRLLDDAVRAANAAGPPSGSASASGGSAAGAAHPAQGGSDAVQRSAAGDDAGVTIGDWAAWSISAAQLYSTCRDQVSNLVMFYDRVRAAKPPEEK